MGKDYSSSMESPLGQRLRDLPGPLLLTGHTGFKGTWMTFLLEHLKVPVVGYSLPAEKESLYDRAERTGAIPEAFADIRDYEELERFIDLHKPSTIIHMAAQPLVLKSYESPRETFDVNVMGTVNVLDIAFKKDFVKAIIVVTTDKVYRNDNSGRAFVETDPLEGKDPYSASKVGTEAVVAAWQQIEKVSGGPKVLSVRAGNVIGGGDFAVNRIIPDLIRGVMSGKPVEIRNPQSTRPWQHVLDPLKGYLLLLSRINNISDRRTFNFGPSAQPLRVKEVVEIGMVVFPTLALISPQKKGGTSSIEASQLALDSTSAGTVLNWRSFIDQEEAIKKTFNWWKQYIEFDQSAESLCRAEVMSFLSRNKSCD
jgi:CDP-glucose 4,6-dehydratase